jgi:hypothetical protein
MKLINSTALWSGTPFREKGGRGMPSVPGVRTTFDSADIALSALT